MSRFYFKSTPLIILSVIIIATMVFALFKRKATVNNNNIPTHIQILNDSYSNQFSEIPLPPDSAPTVKEKSQKSHSAKKSRHKNGNSKKSKSLKEFHPSAPRNFRNDTIARSR